MLAIGWLLIALILVEPYIGLTVWRRFRRELPTRPQGDARLRLYRRTLALEWGYAALIAATVATLPDAWRALGLGAPSLARVPKAVLPALAGGAVGVTLALFVPPLTARGRAFLQSALGEAGALLPANGRERLWFVALALTAGLCEELLYRGFLIFWIERHWPSPLGALALSSLAFGVAHAYQGARGIVGTGLLGAGLGALYLWTGSLWPPIVLHALIDLRAALLSPPRTMAAPSGASSSGASSSQEAAASDRAAT